MGDNERLTRNLNHGDTPDENMRHQVERVGSIRMVFNPKWDFIGRGKLKASLVGDLDNGL